VRILQNLEQRNYHFLAQLTHGSHAVWTNDLSLSDHICINNKPAVTASLHSAKQ